MINIITPVFNNFNFTKSYLKDLCRLPKDVQVVVVDNASTDKTKQLLEEDIPKPSNFKLIRNEENLGFGQASNQGYELTNDDFVIFLNNDIRVSLRKEHWPFDLKRKVDRDKESLFSLNGGLLDDNLNFVRETEKFIDSDKFYLSGWCLFGYRKVFDKLIQDTHKFKGPFDDAAFFCYFEDTDLSFRARQKNIPLRVEKSVLFHFGRMTSRNMNLSKMYNDSRQTFINRWSSK